MDGMKLSVGLLKGDVLGMLVPVTGGDTLVHIIANIWLLVFLNDSLSCFGLAKMIVECHLSL